MGHLLLHVLHRRLADKGLVRLTPAALALNLVRAPIGRTDGADVLLLLLGDDV